MRFAPAAVWVAFTWVAAAGCERRESTSRPGVLTWDQSADQDVSRVGWPADAAGDQWVIEGPVTVDLALNGTDRGRITFEHGTVWRNGGKVAGARLLLAPATLDDAYA